MPVRIADSMKQMNDLNSFPVAYGEDIWLDKNKGSGTPNYDSIQNMLNNDELGVGGSSIQVDTLPVANQSEVGNIYQYVGNNGTYKKGHFYECVLMHNYNGASTSIYVWLDVGHLRFNHVVYNCTVPPVNTDYTPSDIIYYGGKTMGNFKSGHYYRAIPNATPQKYYGVALWVTPSSGYQYLCYTPFEFRIGFIVYPTGTGGESTPYQITDFNDEGITISPYGWSGTTQHFVGASYTTTVEGWEELESGNPVIEDVNVLPTSSDIENRIYRTKSVSPQTTEVLLVIPADVTQNERLIACTNTLSTWTVSGATLYPPKDEYWKWNDKEMYSITCDSTRTVFTTKTQSGGTQDDTYSIDVAWSSNFYVSPYEKAVYAGDKDMETNDRLALYSDVGGNIFYGTMDEWNALSTAEKTKYQFMSDSQSGSDDVISIPNPITRNTVRTSDLYEVGALKQGRIAQIKCYVVFKDIISSTWNTVATVDDSLKPVMETPLIVSEGAVIVKTALFRLSTDGKIQVWGNQIVDGDTTRISATYFTAS